MPNSVFFHHIPSPRKESLLSFLGGNFWYGHIRIMNHIEVLLWHCSVHLSLINLFWLSYTGMHLCIWIQSQTMWPGLFELVVRFICLIVLKKCPPPPPSQLIDFPLIMQYWIGEWSSNLWRYFPYIFYFGILWRLKPITYFIWTKCRKHELCNRKKILAMFYFLHIDIEFFVFLQEIRVSNFFKWLKFTFLPYFPARILFLMSCNDFIFNW